MPIPVAKQALVDARAVTCGVPVSFAPLAALMVLLGAMLPPVRKVIKAGIEHGPWDIRGRQGIVEDAWLETAEGIGVSKGP
jgi:hypothetical protein